MVRSANWSDTELWVLVDKHFFSPYVTASAQSTAWAAITELVNGVGMAGRTANQIEKKWSDHKSHMLTAIQKYKNEMRKTGKLK